MTIPSSVPPGFETRVDRLAIGIEAIDAQRRRRVATRLTATFDGPPDPLPRVLAPKSLGGFAPAVNTLRLISRHDSCVYTVLAPPDLRSPANVRFSDETRRFVPRRFTIPVSADAPAIIRPSFFPGAAYDMSARITGIRGRVLRGGAPMRWARIEARGAADTDGVQRVVGRAQGDDRGEFVLLLGNEAVDIGDLVDPLPIEVVISGPLPTAPVPTGDMASRDPLWDLPLEDASKADVLSGEKLPTGYGETPTSRAVTPFILGKLRSDIPAFLFP